MLVNLASRDPVLLFYGSATLRQQASDGLDDQLSFGTSRGNGVEVHETREREHKDQANISHVCPTTNVGQIN
jgi:hypothetical protein